MARGIVDHEALKSNEIQRLKNRPTSVDPPFRVTKIGHVVLNVIDIERSLDFYTRIMGFEVSDIYPDSMMPGRMAFLRFSEDHHGVALVGGAEGESRSRELHHMAFEVATLDEVFKARSHLEEHGVKIAYEGRRRAGIQIAVEFSDPDGHRLEIYWGLDQVARGEAARPSEEWIETFSLEEAVDNPPEGQDTTLQDPGLRRDKP
ncbi:MAG: VOC family protein [Gammaproteobacteria bacterium]|nr:VOC family protein [Gammaproteobacteria bacterium]